MTVRLRPSSGTTVFLGGVGGAAVALLLLWTAAALARGTGPDTGNRTIPYQGLLELGGVAVTSTVPMTFSLSDGQQSWSYGPQDVPVYSGRFSVLIGEVGEAVPDWVFTAEAVTIAVSVNGTQLGGAQRIRPVPYAYWAAESDNLTVRSTLSVHRIESYGNQYGNLHLDADGSTTDGRIYLNHFDGNGVSFGNGASAEVASVSSSGDITAASAAIAGQTATGTLRATTTELECVWTDCLDSPVAGGAICADLVPGYPILGGLDIALDASQKPSRCTAQYQEDEMALYCCRLPQP